MDAPAVRKAAPQVDVPARLRAWRKHYGMTFVAVAEPAEVTRQAVQKIEARKGRASIDTLQAIVTKGLKLTLAEFFESGPKPAIRSTSMGTVSK